MSDGRRSLAAGLLLLGALFLLTGAAPLLATERPWLARVDGRLRVLPSPAAGVRPSVILRAPVPHGPRRIDLSEALAAPSREHPFGTDAQGRDVLARLLYGGRLSLTAGLIATLFALGTGALLGVAAGAAGPLPDLLASRFADAVNAFPALVGAVALLGFAGPSETPGAAAARVGLVIGLFAWPSLFRYIRAEVHRWAGSEFALAAAAAGAGPLRIGLRHLLPHALTPALAPAAFLAGGAVLVEAGLGFLGLGIRPPAPSWGNLLRDGMLEGGNAWWLALFPGLAVFATVLGFHLLAEGLRIGLAARDEPAVRAA